MVVFTSSSATWKCLVGKTCRPAITPYDSNVCIGYMSGGNFIDCLPPIHIGQSLYTSLQYKQNQTFQLIHTYISYLFLQARQYMSTCKKNLSELVGTLHLLLIDFEQSLGSLIQLLIHIYASLHLMQFVSVIVRCSTVIGEILGHY
jgi:hypothetical protein